MSFVEFISLALAPTAAFFDLKSNCDPLNNQPLMIPKYSTSNLFVQVDKLSADLVWFVFALRNQRIVDFYLKRK